MTKKKEILTKQIWRLAKLYTSRPVTPENIQWHIRVCDLQTATIREHKKLKH